MDGCWLCQRDLARCKSKVHRFATREEADLVIAEINTSRGYQGRLVVRYPCAWCPAWHMKTARTPVERRRIERERRRKAVAARLENASIGLAFGGGHAG